MNRTSITKKLEPYIEKMVEETNLYYVDTVFIKENGNNVLRVYIDSDTGITLDDCERVSQRVSDFLDEKDPIPYSYLLEVSSSGLDRPLKNDRDFKRVLGKNVEFKLFASFNGSKNHKGKLIDFNADELTILDSEGNENIFKRKDISKIRKEIKIGGK